MESRVHPACINASNPYHECSLYCYRKIAEARSADPATVSEETYQSDGNKRKRDADTEVAEDAAEVPQTAPSADADAPQLDTSAGASEDAVDESKLDERQKKLRMLQQKMAEARKKNEIALLAEKRKQDAPKEERGMSKQKWFEEKQKAVAKRLESGGIDKSKMYMLETQEQAEEKYKKWEKKPAAFGWDVFNQKSLYKAYKKRAKTVPNTLEEYAKARDMDPDFYCGENSLQYGKTTQIPEENINRMVQELEERRGKRKEFSRRRRYYEEKDVDAINSRNEHFNRKIERAFGKYTVDIKNNLERGTALPD